MSSEIQPDKINRIVDWAQAEKLLSKTDKMRQQGERKPIPVLIKAKMLFVYCLYDLSDPESVWLNSGIDEDIGKVETLAKARLKQRRLETRRTLSSFTIITMP